LKGKKMMKTILLEEGAPLAHFETYMAMILGSIDSDQYRTLYIRLPDGSLIDVIKDGDLACAFFVSSVLTLCGLTDDGVHTTVDETIRDLEKSGWRRSSVPRVGSVVVWKKRQCTDGQYHRHIGFSIGDGEVVSNNAITGRPKRHPLIERDIVGEIVRSVECFYWYPTF